MADGRFSACSGNQPGQQPGKVVDEGIEHRDAGELEDGAECGERQHAVRIIQSGADPVGCSRKRLEEHHAKEADDRAEQDVSQRRASYREAAADHHQRRGRSRADALAHDHRAPLDERHGSGVQGDQGRRGGSRRALHDDRHHDADAGQDPE
jgi:hypothetical protein